MVLQNFNLLISLPVGQYIYQSAKFIFKVTYCRFVIIYTDKMTLYA